MNGCVRSEIERVLWFYIIYRQTVAVFPTLSVSRCSLSSTLPALEQTFVRVQHVLFSHFHAGCQRFKIQYFRQRCKCDLSLCLLIVNSFFCLTVQSPPPPPLPSSSNFYVCIFCFYINPLWIDSNVRFSFFQDIRFILFPIGLLISAVFLSATLAARYILPANHHILHWRCQTFYVTCLLIGDLLLAFTQLVGRNVNSYACISVGTYFVAYGIISLYTLMNIIFICLTHVKSLQ